MKNLWKIWATLGISLRTWGGPFVGPINALLPKLTPIDVLIALFESGTKLPFKKCPYHFPHMTMHTILYTLRWTPSIVTCVGVSNLFLLVHVKQSLVLGSLLFHWIPPMNFLIVTCSLPRCPSCLGHHPCHVVLRHRCLHWSMCLGCQIVNILVKKDHISAILPSVAGSWSTSILPPKSGDCW